MRLLCLKPINHGLEWIFIGKMLIKLPIPMTFTSLKLNLQLCLANR